MSLEQSEQQKEFSKVSAPHRRFNFFTDRSPYRPLQHRIGTIHTISIFASHSSSCAGKPASCIFQTTPGCKCFFGARLNFSGLQDTTLLPDSGPSS